MRLSRHGLLLAIALLAGTLVARADDPLAGAPGDQGALRARAFSGERTHARRRALTRALGERAVVVCWSGAPNGSDFREHRPHRDFLYLSGVVDPGCGMILSGESDVLFAPPRNAMAEAWTGEHVIPGALTAQKLGFREARSTDDWKEAVRQAVQDGPSKVFLSGLDPKELAAIVTVPAGVVVERAASAVARLRQVKDEDELALLARAATISATAFLHAARAIAPGRHEFEVQGLFEGACRFYGAEAQGYPSIVGSGPNSCILHYSANRRRMQAGELVLIDAAGECGGYSADVTRTFPVSGKFTPEQRRIYEAVLRAQEAGIAACKPGATVGDVSEAARAVLRSEDLVQHLPHGVSHWLGLDVHDAGDYARPFEPGMVLTVEPGCYLGDRALGVRIEDDVLVTEAGPVSLSAHAPRSADEVEALLLRARGGQLVLPALPADRAAPLRARRGKLY